MTVLYPEGLNLQDVATFGYKSDRWNFVEGEALNGMIAKLNKEQNRYVISPNASRVMWRTLPFYAGATLVRVTDLLWRPAGLTTYFIGFRGQYRRMDGSRHFIQFLNDKLPIKLTAQNVLEYLRFYCFFVRHRGRPFLLVEKLDDLGTLAGQPLTAAQSDAISALLAPLALLTAENNLFTISAIVRYGEVLFKCTFSITAAGAVQMVEEQEIYQGLAMPTGVDVAPAWSE